MPTLRALLALLAVLALATSAGASAAIQAPAAGAASPPVSAKSWRSDPRIVAIRTLVRSHQAAMTSRRWRSDPARRCRSAERSFAAEAIGVRDEERRIRVYVTSSGTDDSSYRVEQHYDDAGRLRFVLAHAGASNGASIEYRLFLDEWGKELWRDVRARGSYTFLRPPEFPDAALVRVAAAAPETPLRCPP